jgi:DNA-binding transcriptional MerR regulator
VSETDAQLTIDELARRVGMSVRNVRAHQSRGLLPAPEIRGRTGYYGPGHVSRLELVQDLQNEGFNLEAIRRIIENADGQDAQVLGFTRAAVEPFTDEEPEVVDAADVLAGWGDQITPEVLERIVALGFIRPLGDGRYETLSPMLERASSDLAQTGIPLAAVLDALEELTTHVDAIARTYVELFLAHVWRPAAAKGDVEEHWEDIRKVLERLRPLANQSVSAIFGIMMTRAAEQALERELERLSREPRRRPR